jgi:hypothetical protein
MKPADSRRRAPPLRVRAVGDKPASGVCLPGLLAHRAQLRAELRGTERYVARDVNLKGRLCRLCSAHNCHGCKLVPGGLFFRSQPSRSRVAP